MDGYNLLKRPLSNLGSMDIFRWVPFLKRGYVEDSNNSNLMVKRMRFDLDNSPQSEGQESSFMDTVKKILSCAVCFEVGSQTKQCKNGHLICFQCITRMQQSTADFNCPVCRCSLKKGLMRSLIAEQMVLELPALCEFCSTSMSLKELRKHEKSLCPLRKTSCQFDIFGCPWTGKAEASEVHSAACEFRDKPVHEIQSRVHEYTKEIKDVSQKSISQWSALIEKIKESGDGYNFQVKQIILNRRRLSSSRSKTSTILFKSPNIYHSHACCRRHGWVLECYLETDPFKLEYKLINDSKKKYKVSFFVASIQYDDRNVFVVDQLHTMQFSRTVRDAGRYELDLTDHENHINALKVSETISFDLCIFSEVDSEEATAEAEEEEAESEASSGAGNFLLALLSPNLQNGAAEEDAESASSEASAEVADPSAANPNEENADNSDNS